MIYSPGLEPAITASAGLLDCLEIEPQMFWLRRDELDNPFMLDPRLIEKLDAFKGSKLVHSVGAPIGGKACNAAAQMATLRETVSALDAPWISEHLSFNCVESGPHMTNAGFLLPPSQTEQGVKTAVNNIAAFQDGLDVPFAFETGVNYLKPQDDEMSDAEFITAISGQADCGILLDLHNLWANHKNGRQDILELIDQIPLERVWEVHLAGGEVRQGYWLDAHSGLVPHALYELAQKIIPKLPNLKAIIFEVMEDYVAANNISATAIKTQITDLRRLWDIRATDRQEPKPAQKDKNVEQPLVEKKQGESSWEIALCHLVTGQDYSIIADYPTLENDPGIPIYQDLIRNVRAGMIVSTLTLTYRFLVMQLSAKSVDGLLQSFWASTPPEPFAADEAANFVEFLREQHISIHHLSEVMAFELASHTVKKTGEAQTIRFECDPMELLSALGEKRTIPDLEAGNFELTIQP